MKTIAIIRLAHSIEVLAGFLLIGMMFITTALSNGVPRLILGLIAIFCIMLIRKGFVENIKERKFYELSVNSDSEKTDET